MFLIKKKWGLGGERETNLSDVAAFPNIFLKGRLQNRQKYVYFQLVRVRARQKSGGLGNKFGKKTRFNVKAAGGGISGVKGQP